MKKFLSVLLALMMVVSTVSFAVPSAVTTADNATNAVAEDATQATTEKEEAELADDSEYGTLVFNIDFEKDGISFTKNKSVAVNTITDNYNSEICPSGVVFYPNSMDEDPQLVTDANGNTYLNYTNTAATEGYRFFKISETDSTLDWKDGTFTVLVDYYYTGGLNSIAFHINSSSNFTAISPVVYKHSTWQTAIGQYTSQLRDFYIAPGYAANYTNSFGVDNIRLYYSAETANVTIKSDNATTATADGVVAVNRTTGMTVSDIVANANMTDLMGIAETKNGTMLSASTVITPVYAKSYYGVFGYDVNVLPGENTAVSSVSILDTDTRNSMTVADIIARINNPTSRVLRGLATTANGEPLSPSTVINTNTTLYMIWQAEESEYGTLVFNIDFEKDGISIPDGDSFVAIRDITDNYNSTLVPDSKVDFGARFATANELVTNGGNTYLVSTRADGGGYINLYAREYSDNVNWLNGTYTMMVDAMVLDTKADNYVVHVNDASTGVSLVDSFSNEIGVWDRVTYSFEGKLSQSSDKRHYYIAFSMPEGKQIAFDNYKLYFKTDETIVTLKANGNSDLSDIEVPVSTSTGITVAELIEEANQYPTTHTLLGISDSGTGELLAEDTLIKPSYQEAYYLIWQTADNDPTISTQYGKLLFNVDFERDSILESGWNGHLSLDDNRYTAGSFPTHIASYYDEDVFTGKNFRIKFLTSNDTTDASIKTDASSNHYLSGTATSQWPQIAISNNAKLEIGAGYYTVFFDSYSKTGAAASMGVNTPAGSTILEGGNSANTAFSVPNGEWKSYAFKFELNEGAVFPNMVVNYNLAASDKGSAIVGWDDFKVYFKPYEATVTILPGDYEEFGETTITGIDTTTATTLETVISSMMTDINLSGRGFAGLMDQYGEMVDLTKSVIIPCDMTYTIIWEEENEYAPDTWDKTSVRYSTKETSKGVRFAAGTTVTNTNAASEYGWVIARADVLNAAGIKATSLTKNTFDGDPSKVINGKNFGEGVTGGGEDGRKHFSVEGDNVVITAVITGVPAKYYNTKFTVRPYIVIDGTTHYGKPFTRSIAEAAVKVKEADYVGCDDATKAYVDEIIANTPSEN